MVDIPPYADNSYFIYTDGPWVGHVVGKASLEVGNFKELVGGALKKEDYPALYEVIGHLYGEDEETFNLPDLRAKIVEKEG